MELIMLINNKSNIYHSDLNNYDLFYMTKRSK